MAGVWRPDTIPISAIPLTSHVLEKLGIQLRELAPQYLHEGRHVGRPAARMSKGTTGTQRLTGNVVRRPGTW